MTAKEMAAQIEHALVDLKKFVFRCHSDEKPLGNQASVLISFASVPAGSGELACLNSKKHIMIHVTAAAGEKWSFGEPAPSKVTADAFRYGGMKMRKKTGSPEQVIEHIVKAFVAGGPY